MKRGLSTLLCLAALPVSSCASDDPSIDTVAVGTVAEASEHTGPAHGRPPSDRSPRPSIVVITVDTLRSDHLPMYGYEQVATPALDALRSHSILYERAYSPVPLTLPAHASIFTGLLPIFHGIRDNTGYRLEAESVSLAEILQEAGYTTGGAVSSFVLRQETGIAQGFDFYDDEVTVVARGTAAESVRAGSKTIEVAVRWMESIPAAKPAFLFVHLYEPHAPYLPPPPFDEQYREHPYDGEIAFTDGLVGKLLESLVEIDRYNSSAIFLLSDHGEGLGQHGEDQHGILLNREMLQVPLLLKLPDNSRANTSIRRSVQLPDVFPTVVSLAGINTIKDQRSDAISLLEETGPTNPRPLFAESYYPELRLGWRGLRSVILDNHHYIAGVYGQLFDLDRDPLEETDIAQQDRATVRTSQALIEALPARFEKPEHRTSASEAENLSSLGYLVSPVSASPQLDPRQEVRSLKRYLEALDLLKGRQAEQARSLLRQIVKEQSGFVGAWEFLGLAAEELGDKEEAYAAFRQAFSLTGGSDALLLPLGRLAFGLGKMEEALALLPLAVEANPQATEPRALLTQALVATDRLNDALSAAKSNLETLPDNLDLRYQLALVYLFRRDLEAAETGFREVLSLDATYVPALSDLAVTLGHQERWLEASQLLSQVVSLRPNDQLVRENLAYVEKQLRPMGGG